jgi:hypothetical protein
MYIRKRIYAIQGGMALLDDGKPKNIGGISEKIDLELEDGSVVDSYCVFFNLMSNVDSTDYFIFLAENEKLVCCSIGKRTNPFFEKIYLKLLSLPENHSMKSFINEFVGEYITNGLMGTFP